MQDPFIETLITTLTLNLNGARKNLEMFKLGVKDVMGKNVEHFRLQIKALEKKIGLYVKAIEGLKRQNFHFAILATEEALRQFENGLKSLDDGATAIIPPWSQGKQLKGIHNTDPQVILKAVQETLTELRNRQAAQN